MDQLIFDIEDQQIGDVFFYHTLTESIINSIPSTIRKYFQSKENRKQLLDEIGKAAFLLPAGVTSPLSGMPPWIRNFSMSYSLSNCEDSKTKGEK